MKNFRHGKYKGPVVKIRNPKFEFDEDKARTRETHLMQKASDITSPGTNPIKREIYEENYYQKKKKMQVDNKYLKSSLETNPYYMKEPSDGEEDGAGEIEEGSIGSARSTERDSKTSKMHETAKDFFQRHHLQATKQLSKYDCWDSDLTPDQWIEKCNMYPERTHGKCPFYRDGQ